MLRTDLVAQLELLAYRIEYEARLPAEQAHAEAIERVDVLVSIQVPQMRALRSLDHDLVGHLLEHRLEAVDHAWVGHVPTVGLRVLLRLSGTCDVTLDDGVELSPLVQAKVVAAGLVDPGQGAEGLLDVLGGEGHGGLFVDDSLRACLGTRLRFPHPT